MQKFVSKLTVLAIATPLLFSNCASIVSKSSYPISVNSNPSGATVSITDKKGNEIFKGQSPAIAILKSGAGFFAKAQYQVKISSPGFAEQIVPVTFKMNGWYWGNILFGGLIGMLIVDPATGAMWKLESSPINVTLNKSTTSIETPSLKIIDIASVPQNMKDKLVRIK